MPLRCFFEQLQWAAIEINNHQARNMDDVQSLGVIYINHNFATESEARQALNEETDAQGATYYHVILMREPGSNGNMHASADIYLLAPGITNETLP
ncbi:DUF1471 domain-containing protein [Salmonella enterica]|nr:DUF1471 domain-containing protein [Salmonella enterica]